MPNNSENLTQSKTAKSDEFYTALEDIEKEIQYYPGQFKDKIVYCNCDNPLYSDFFKYFLLNFSTLGLKKLICTCYDSNYNESLSLWDEIYTEKQAYKFIINKPVFTNPTINSYTDVDKFIQDAILNKDKSYVTVLNENGDFRSTECIKILNESDIVVTNPPFSLFTDFINLLIKYNKKFLVLGNINAVASNDVFSHLKANRMRLGESIHSGDRKFYVPDDYPLYATGCGVDKNGKRYIKVKGVRWYTNLPSLSVAKPFLVTDYLYSKKEELYPDLYPTYENYNAINVDKTNEIPMDYKGEMGVPITFLDKYNPDQFEIVGADFELADPVINNEGKLEKRRFYIRQDGVLQRLYARIVIKAKNLK